jgi:histone H3/H4
MGIIAKDGRGVMSEVLVVASKVKKYIKDKAGMNTSGTVMEALTKLVERECQKAIEHAQQDKRKTVMDRDFTP